MAFRQGDKKPPGSGSVKGKPQRKTVLRRELVEAFEANGLCLGEEIAKAIAVNDHERVDTLLKVAPYLWAKYGPRTPAGENGGAAAFGVALSAFVQAGRLPDAERKAEGNE